MWATRKTGPRLFPTEQRSTFGAPAGRPESRCNEKIGRTPSGKRPWIPFGLVGAAAAG